MVYDGPIMVPAHSCLDFSHVSVPTPGHGAAFAVRHRATREALVREILGLAKSTPASQLLCALVTRPGTREDAGARRLMVITPSGWCVPFISQRREHRTGNCVSFVDAFDNHHTSCVRSEAYACVGQRLAHMSLDMLGCVYLGAFRQAIASDSVMGSVHLWNNQRSDMILDVRVPQGVHQDNEKALLRSTVARGVAADIDEGERTDSVLITTGGTAVAESDQPAPARQRWRMAQEEHRCLQSNMWALAHWAHHIQLPPPGWWSTLINMAAHVGEDVVVRGLERTFSPPSHPGCWPNRSTSTTPPDPVVMVDQAVAEMRNERTQATNNVWDFSFPLYVAARTRQHPSAAEHADLFASSQTHSIRHP